MRTSAAWRAMAVGERGDPMRRERLRRHIAARSRMRDVPPPVIHAAMGGLLSPVQAENFRVTVC